MTNSKNYEENFSDAQYHPLDIDEDSDAIEILSEMEGGESGVECGNDD